MARRNRGDSTAAAAVITAGSATFLAGAFMPISQVYVEGDPQRKLAILLADPGQWRAQQLILAAGTAALPVGVVMPARRWDTGLELATGVALLQRLRRGRNLGRGQRSPRLSM